MTKPHAPMFGVVALGDLSLLMNLVRHWRSRAEHLRAGKKTAERATMERAAACETCASDLENALAGIGRFGIRK